jgi:hypothetical protein
MSDYENYKGTSHHVSLSVCVLNRHNVQSVCTMKQRKREKAVGRRSADKLKKQTNKTTSTGGDE